MKHGATPQTEQWPAAAPGSFSEMTKRASEIVDAYKGLKISQLWHGNCCIYEVKT